MNLILLLAGLVLAQSSDSNSSSNNYLIDIVLAVVALCGLGLYFYKKRKESLSRKQQMVMALAPPQQQLGNLPVLPPVLIPSYAVPYQPTFADSAYQQQPNIPQPTYQNPVNVGTNQPSFVPMNSTDYPRADIQPVESLQPRVMNEQGQLTAVPSTYQQVSQANSRDIPVTIIPQ
ncbi:hypothetical protein HK103_005069 [Boothiomyces macroporosus]|uniref:Uncharacterized protein n=1 Tax=Boothiomyces macroporosus TaxID=261099 RepID=A0AAD5UFX5_9FUNG|nr:hypothetical protein HK103_005069 [Boothiomyces macroporosus]